MANNISDKKALQLQEFSNGLKGLINGTRVDSPKWTEAFETTLSKLATKDIEHLTFLLQYLTTAKQTGTMPS